MSDEKIIRVNYSSNSHKERGTAKEGETPAREERKVEKIEGVSAVKRKKPLGRKIAETFTGDDMGSVGSYVLFDVLLPAAKNAVVDAVTQGIERAFFGTTTVRNSSVSSRSRTSNYVPYGRSSTSRVEPERDLSRRSRATHDFDEIVLQTRGQAEEVLDRLAEQIELYGWATVSDLYESVGITGSFADNKWGWNNLNEARVRPVRQGYLLDLPRTIVID